VSAPSVKTVENSYEIGELEKGDYEFIFMSSNEEVKAEEFTIDEETDEIPGFTFLLAVSTLLSAFTVILLENKYQKH